MVTFNVETDLDIGNGARREITEIALDERETAFLPIVPIVELAYPPAYIRQDESHEGSSTRRTRERCLIASSAGTHICDCSRERAKNNREETAACHASIFVQTIDHKVRQSITPL
jgi:hypothetical protein